MGNARSRAAGVSLLLAMSASGFCHANNVQLIFAAENALYAAGFDIGQADGWMDEPLTRAIQQYQTQNPNLSRSGTLDSDTLTALGISAPSTRLVMGNVVPSRAEAMSALGLTTATALSASTPAAPVKKARRAPETGLQPVAPFTAEAPEQPKPVATVTGASPKPATPVEPSRPTSAARQPEPAPKPVVESVTAPVATATIAAEPTSKREMPLSTQPVPAGAPEPVSAPVPTAEPAQAQPAQTADAPAEPNDATLASASDAPSSESPAKASTMEIDVAQEAASTVPEPAPPAQSRVANAPKTERPAPSSTGSFFSSLFDFLFGWLV